MAGTSLGLSIYRNPHSPGHIRRTFSILNRRLVELEEAVVGKAIADSALSFGEVVYWASSGHVDLARADAESTSFIAGMVIKQASVNGGTRFLTSGVVENVAWSLTAGDTYFLSPTVAGAITRFVPTVSGQYVVELGRALTTTQLQFRPQRRILLDLAS